MNENMSPHNSKLKNISDEQKYCVMCMDHTIPYSWNPETEKGQLMSFSFHDPAAERNSDIRCKAVICPPCLCRLVTQRENHDIKERCLVCNVETEGFKNLSDFRVCLNASTKNLNLLAQSKTHYLGQCFQDCVRGLFECGLKKVSRDHMRLLCLSNPIHRAILEGMFFFVSFSFFFVFFCINLYILM